MTGLSSRHPANGPGHRRDEDRNAAGRFPATLFRHGPVNVCVCHLLVLSLVATPLALLFAVRHADTADRWLQAHYLYVRTSIALLVIGVGLGSLCILLGAPTSAFLMLAGLGLVVATLLLMVMRCANGIFRALRGLSLRNPKSYLV